MNRTKIPAFCDNNKMITESILKKNLVHLTGNIRFCTVERTSKQGAHLKKDKQPKQSYTLAFEVITPHGNEYQDVFTDLNKPREFATLSSVEKFLKKIEALNWENMHGAFNFNDKSNQTQI